MDYKTFAKACLFHRIVHQPTQCTLGERRAHVGWVGKKTASERASSLLCVRFCFCTSVSLSRRMQKVRRETTHSLCALLCLFASSQPATTNTHINSVGAPASERSKVACRKLRAGCKQAAKQEALHKFKLSLRLRVIKT